GPGRFPSHHVAGDSETPQQVNHPPRTRRITKRTVHSSCSFVPFVDEEFPNSLCHFKIISYNTVTFARARREKSSATRGNGPILIYSFGISSPCLEQGAGIFPFSLKEEFPMFRRFVLALSVLVIGSGSLMADELRGTIKKVSPTKNSITLTVND